MSVANELELESELAAEGESEFELAGELEHELGEAHELVHEFEMEHEQESEHEAFFNHLAAMADRGGRSQALRRIALAAARSALRGQARSWPVVEGESELELEHEGGFALKLDATPAQQRQFAAMMEHAGHAAAEAANEQEAAEHFLPLIPLAAKFALPLLGKALPFAAKAAAKLAPKILGKVVPNLTRGLGNIARTLFRNRTTRPLLHAVPRIARGTMRTLAQRAARGRRVTPRQAVRTLAGQTYRTLRDPRVLAQTYRRSLALDRRFHRNSRRMLGRPSGPIVRAANDAGAPPLGGFPGGLGSPAGPGSPAHAVPIVPGIAPGGWGWPAQTSGGCRCTCQPLANAGGAMPTMAAPAPVTPAAPTCPTCGR